VVLGSLLRLSGYAGQAGLEGRGVRLKAKGKRDEGLKTGRLEGREVEVIGQSDLG
jgi:hypothetical protein